MVVAVDKMTSHSMKSILKVTVSNSGSSASDSDSDNSDESENQDSSIEDQETNEQEDTGAENNSKTSEKEEDSESGNSEGEKSALITNEGWADSVAKILGSNKPKNKKTLVLSRAKKYKEPVNEVKDEKPSFEVIGDGDDKKDIKVEVKQESDATTPLAKRKKYEKTSIRAKPNILEKDRERLLTKIATKGVVQLFNAVRNQQKSLDRELENDVSERKKDKILKKFDKRTFLDTLMGQTKSVVVDDNVKKLKDEVKDEETPKWSALRDDFMTGAKMKDWDKESVDD